MNKFTLQSIGALILSFLLIFSVACTSGEKKEKSTAKEGKQLNLLYQQLQAYKMR